MQTLLDMRAGARMCQLHTGTCLFACYVLFSLLFKIAPSTSNTSTMLATDLNQLLTEPLFADCVLLSNANVSFKIFTFKC